MIMDIPKLVKLVGTANGMWGSPTILVFFHKAVVTRTKQAVTPFEETFSIGAC